MKRLVALLLVCCLCPLLKAQPQVPPNFILINWQGETNSSALALAYLAVDIYYNFPQHDQRFATVEALEDVARDSTSSTNAETAMGLAMYMQAQTPPLETVDVMNMAVSNPPPGMTPAQASLLVHSGYFESCEFYDVDDNRKLDFPDFLNFSAHFGEPSYEFDAFIVFSRYFGKEF